MVQRKEIRERTETHSVYLTLSYLMIIICCLAMLIIMVMTGIQFIHVMMLLPIYMLKVTGLTRLYV